MFYRFLGRIFLYFWILPAVYRYVRPILIDVMRNVADKQVASMTQEQKERYESYMSRVRPKRS